MTEIIELERQLRTGLSSDRAANSVSSFFRKLETNQPMNRRAILSGAGVTPLRKR